MVNVRKKNLKLEWTAFNRKTGVLTSIIPSNTSCMTRRPYICSSSSDLTHLTTTAVELKLTQAPTKRASLMLAPMTAPTKMNITTVANRISSAPPRARRHIARILSSENSNPRTNTINITPSWARVSVWINSLIRSYPDGPAKLPANI